MKIKDDEMIIKRREYIDLLMENAKLKEQSSPFHKYSINEIREMLGFFKIELEEKKIPEKIDDINCNYYVNDCYYEKLSKEEIALDITTLLHKINEIIDYLKRKGDK